MTTIALDNLRIKITADAYGWSGEVEDILHGHVFDMEQQIEEDTGEWDNVLVNLPSTLYGFNLLQGWLEILRPFVAHCEREPGNPGGYRATPS